MKKLALTLLMISGATGLYAYMSYNAFKKPAGHCYCGSCGGPCGGDRERPDNR